MARAAFDDRKLVAAAFGAVTVVLLLPVLFGQHTFGLDLGRVDHGLHCEVRWLLDHGERLWLTPHLGEGGPLWARPTAQVLYPLRWPTWLFGPGVGLSLHVAVHLGLLAAGTALLLRTFRVRPPVAVAAGVTFAACGTSIDLIGHTSYLVGAAWLPWSWALLRRLFAPRRRLTAAAGLLFVLTMQLLGGEPQAYATAGGLLLVEAAVRYRYGRGLLAPLAVGLGAMVGALLLAAPLLAPMLSEAALTRRGGFSTDVLTSFGVWRPAGWWALLVPLDLAFDAPARALDQHYGADGQLWNAHPYLGLAVVGLAWVGSARARVRSASVVAGGALVMALGSFTPVLGVLLTVFPPLKLFRYPAKYLVVASLALVVMAFVSIDRARGGPGARQARVGLALGGGLGLSGALIAARTADVVGAAVLPALVTPVVTVLVALGASMATRHRPLAVGAAVGAGVALVTLPWLDVGPPVDDVSPIATQLGVKPGERLCVDEARLARLPGITSDVPWERAVAERAALIPDLGACQELTSGVTYSTLMTDAEVELAIATEQSVHLGAYRALGCDRVMVGTGDARLAELRPVPNAMPEAWIVPSPRVVDTSEAARAAMVDEGVLPSIVDWPLGEGGEIPSRVGARLSSVSQPSVTTWELTVEGAPAVVALRTSYRRGWRAEQAGRSLPLVRVSATKLGVVVREPSAGPVTVRYRPPAMNGGFALSGLAGLLVIGVWIWRRRRA